MTIFKQFKNKLHNLINLIQIYILIKLKTIYSYFRGLPRNIVTPYFYKKLLNKFIFFIPVFLWSVCFDPSVAFTTRDSIPLTDEHKKTIKYLVENPNFLKGICEHLNIHKDFLPLYESHKIPFWFPRDVKVLEGALNRALAGPINTEEMHLFNPRTLIAFSIIKKYFKPGQTSTLERAVNHQMHVEFGEVDAIVDKIINNNNQEKQNAHVTDWTGVINYVNEHPGLIASILVGISVCIVGGVCYFYYRKKQSSNANETQQSTKSEDSDSDNDVFSSDDD